MAARSVYWGDTHVHSSYSLNANLSKNKRLDDEFADFETWDKTNILGEGDGGAKKRVYDVALAKLREAGAAQFAVTWRGPDFDPTALAFYYVRVLEVTTPRWTAYDAKRFGSAIAPGTRMEHQERVYTSPIWYTPPR